MTSIPLHQMESKLLELVNYTNKAYTENHLRALDNIRSEIANKRIITDIDFTVLESIRQECRMMLKMGEDEWVKEKYFYLLCESDRILESILLNGLTSMDIYTWNRCFSLLSGEITGFILKNELANIEYVSEFLGNVYTDILDYLKFYESFAKVDEEGFFSISAKMLAKDFECFKRIIDLILTKHFYKERDFEQWPTLEEFCRQLRQINIDYRDVPLIRDTLALLAAEFVYSLIRKRDHIELLEAVGNIGFTASILEKRLDEALYLEHLTDFLNGLHTVLSHFAGAIKDLKQY